MKSHRFYSIKIIFAPEIKANQFYSVVITSYLFGYALFISQQHASTGLR